MEKTMKIPRNIRKKIAVSELGIEEWRRRVDIEYEKVNKQPFAVSKSMSNVVDSVFKEKGESYLRKKYKDLINEL